MTVAELVAILSHFDQSKEVTFCCHSWEGGIQMAEEINDCICIYSDEEDYE